MESYTHKGRNSCGVCCVNFLVHSIHRSHCHSTHICFAVSGLWVLSRTLCGELGSCWKLEKVRESGSRILGNGFNTLAICCNLDGCRKREGVCCGGHTPFQGWVQGFVFNGCQLRYVLGPLPFFSFDLHHCSSSMLLKASSGSCLLVGMASGGGSCRFYQQPVRIFSDKKGLSQNSVHYLSTSCVFVSTHATM